MGMKMNLISLMEKSIHYIKLIIEINLYLCSNVVSSILIINLPSYICTYFHHELHMRKMMEMIVYTKENALRIQSITRLFLSSVKVQSRNWHNILPR